MGYGMYHGWHGWGIFGGCYWIFGLIFMVLIIWLVVRISATNFRNSSGTNTAMEILKERYARGEIDKEEFETKKRDLQR